MGLGRKYWCWFWVGRGLLQNHVGVGFKNYNLKTAFFSFMSDSSASTSWTQSTTTAITARSLEIEIPDGVNHILRPSPVFKFFGKRASDSKCICLVKGYGKAYKASTSSTNLKHHLSTSHEHHISIEDQHQDEISLFLRKLHPVLLIKRRSFRNLWSRTAI